VEGVIGSPRTRKLEKGETTNVKIKGIWVAIIPYEAKGRGVVGTKVSEENGRKIGITGAKGEHQLNLVVRQWGRKGSHKKGRYVVRKIKNPKK